MVGRYSAYRRGTDPVIDPEVLDRVMVGVCAAIWLVLVGVSVAAGVALADLGRGYHTTPRSTATSWVLYAVIVVSALVIAGAIPVLLKARKITPEGPVVRSKALLGSGSARAAVKRAEPGTAEPARGEPGKAAGAPDQWSGEAVDRVWMRGTVALTAVLGAALTGAALATYFMAAGKDGASWVSYGIAGAIAVGMPVTEWFYVRQLRQGQAGRQ
ncbi:DUF2561 family protein [Mycobacterium sp.]|uniref:DUF2561 family protein n=1 Tax=Mycobacterium sp. TaxID=1785 RepID=UPI003A8629AE